MLVVIIAAAVILLCVVFFIFHLEKQGQRNEQNDQMERRLNDIHAANNARDKLSHDLADAKRVRERFTRELL